MREDLKKSFRGRFFLNVIISAILTYIVLFALMINTVEFDAIFLDNEVTKGPYEWLLVHMDVSLVVFTGIGICLFAFIFSILNRPQMKYIREISTAMKKISAGALDTALEVRGDDELSWMAATLNTMTEDIKLLIQKEREAEVTKNELITNVAHDLRTPLTSILGYLDLLEQNKNISEETKIRYIQVANQKTKRLQVLIDELFGFTKLTNGRIAMQAEEMDLVKLVEQVMDEFYPLFEENDLEIDYQKNVSSLIITADGNLLARLLDNLISNAVKYGKEGKMIRIYLEYEEPIITISVMNYGYVIPEDEINLVFEKFYRLEQSRSSKTGGTGLGLAIAKKIVDLHGGKISVTSDLNGTVFEVKLRKDFSENYVQFKEIEEDM